MVSGYTGHPWDELARRLVARALPDLEQSIRTGSINQRCRWARLGIPQRQELQRRPLAQDIAAEAVEDCLERFKVQVLPRGEWDPVEGGEIIVDWVGRRHLARPPADITTPRRRD